MSEPLKHNAQSELVSAISALNTEVTYTGPDMIDGEWVFIADAEPMAKHSIEHISAAMEMMNDIRSNDIRKIRVVVEHLMRDMGGWDKLPFERWDEFDNAIRTIENKL
jgi:hypothetical protein